MGKLEMECPKCGNRDLNHFSVSFLVKAVSRIDLAKFNQKGDPQTQMEAWVEHRPLFWDETTIPKFLYYLKHKKTYPYAIRGQWVVLEIRWVRCQKCQAEVKPTRFGV